jgi:hypothetical protein
VFHGVIIQKLHRNSNPQFTTWAGLFLAVAENPSANQTERDDQTNRWCGMVSRP